MGPSRGSVRTHGSCTCTRGPYCIENLVLGRTNFTGVLRFARSICKLLYLDLATQDQEDNIYRTSQSASPKIPSTRVSTSISAANLHAADARMGMRITERNWNVAACLMHECIPYHFQFELRCYSKQNCWTYTEQFPACISSPDSVKSLLLVMIFLYSIQLEIWLLLIKFSLRIINSHSTVVHTK